MDTKLKNKIKDWQNRLLDTSRRNPLINFRRPKRTSIKVIDELPTEVYRQLVLKNEKFTFHSTTIDEENDEDLGSDDSKEFETYNKDELKDIHTDNNLQTNLDDENLFRNLKAIQYKAQDILEEQGYNNLFLTLGMLQWYEADHSDVKNISPLILVPVTLAKKSVKSQFTLVKTDEDPIINLSLQEKLNEFGITLPDLPSNEDYDPKVYFETIQQLISNKKGWKVKIDIYLGFFSFANFVMFKDLEKFL